MKGGNEHKNQTLGILVDLRVIASSSFMMQPWGKKSSFTKKVGGVNI